MELEAAKLIGAALALLPIAGVGIGLGMIFSSYNEAVGRNPSSAEILEKKFLLTFALTEALAIFALVIAFMIMFS
ncbi:MAG: F0F1 ATP synthase subunit C [Micavibrio sp. TMED27]|nr:F0F1 ATP synthase subunit C [Micavibrio sp.]OUT90939.1 MAG: F0F1 ATP synthase subunit C [Micavibrio sp. TMED27]|tara:strand:+ start:62 stop:286 length:225 start_codon:yes stop_codon:yes gene_type:complete